MLLFYCFHIIISMITVLLYCRPPGFTVMPQGKYLAGGLQSGCTANSIGAQYIFTLANVCDYEYKIQE